MLYLLLPSMTMKRIDLPAKTILELAKTHAFDLGALKWLPSERVPNMTVLRLALRQGAAASQGIVVPATVIVEEGRAAELASTFWDSVAAHEKLAAMDRFIEQLAPGWIERGQKLNDEIAETVAKAMEESMVDIAEALAVAPKPELIDHWLSLGGPAPEPDA
jgi:hypothetical protein